jgi:hypothetical protein
MATGNGRLSAERKGKDPFNFHNHAKFWLNCNQLPPVQKSEDCDAYYNRLIIVDYNHKVPKEKQNPNLINELTTPQELSGYLNYALDGLERLLKNKRFSETLSKEDIRAIYIKRTDSAKYFVENFIQVTDEYSDCIFHEELFRAAVKKCHQEKIRPMSKAELSKAMQLHCTGAQYTKIRPEPKRSLKEAYRYIKLKIEIEEKKGQIKLNTSSSSEQNTMHINDTKQTQENSKNINTQAENYTSNAVSESQVHVPSVPFVQPSSNSLAKIENKKDTSNFEKPKNTNELSDPCTNGTNGTNQAAPTQETKGPAPVEVSEAVDKLNKFVDRTLQAKHTIPYRLLAPTEPAPCDGEYKGGACGFEAKYKVDSNHYCQEHFDRAKKSCEDNGFTLVEQIPEPPTGDGQ